MSPRYTGQENPGVLPCFEKNSASCYGQWPNNKSNADYDPQSWSDKRKQHSN